ncbi:MAG: RDD family protein [Bacilli bacterium]|nr:RDD family protein [Bacilli bacterium]
MNKHIAKIRYRILSTIVDVIVNGIAIAVILLITSSWQILTLFLGNTAVINAPILLKLIEVGILIAVFFVIYFAIVPLYTKGQTLGCFLFKIRMVQQDGTNVTFLSLFVRSLLGQIALPLLTLGTGVILNLILMLYRKDNCGVHDVLAKTVMVDA